MTSSTLAGNQSSTRPDKIGDLQSTATMFAQSERKDQLVANCATMTGIRSYTFFSYLRKGVKERMEKGIKHQKPDNHAGRAQLQDTLEDRGKRKLIKSTDGILEGGCGILFNQEVLKNRSRMCR